MKVVIAGVGDVGRELAENLSRRKDNQLVLIDLDEKRCEHLAGELDALVLHGDGANPEILKKARLEDADALVATTGSDATNTVIAMLAHNLKVKTLIVKLNDNWLRAACREIGVNKIVAPKISAAAQILASLYGLDRLDFSPGVRDGMQLVELSASQSQGKQLSELDLPDDALVVGVLRGSQTLFPNRKTRIEKDDVLLMLVEDEGAATRVKKLLSA